MNDDNMPADPQEDEFDGPSKSQLKRDAKAIFAFGEKLVALPESKRAELPLEQNVLNAISICAKIKKHGGRKRQMLYIGKLLRHVDLDPVYEKYAELTEQTAVQKRHFKRLEEFRDELLNGNDKILDDVFSACPNIDRQQLRQLTRNSRAERTANKTPTSARKLFQLLKDAFEAESE